MAGMGWERILQTTFTKVSVEEGQSVSAVSREREIILLQSGESVTQNFTWNGFA